MSYGNIEPEIDWGFCSGEHQGRGEMTTREEAAATAMLPLVKKLEATMLAQVTLAAADAHDLANNVHRVRLDDATVERVARALWNGNTEADWDLLDESSTIAHGVKDRYRQVARAVLAAAVEGKP